MDNRVLSKLFLVSLSLLMVMLTGNAFAQKEDKIKAILKASDIKKIEKADGNKEVADKLMEEATMLYKETLAMKSSKDFDEKEIKKKVKQLEGQTRKKITEASDLYQERNGTKYRLYKIYIEKFWLHFEGNEASFENAKKIEEQSNDLYYQAVISRTQANKMPDEAEKIQKLNQAIESENQAIDKQLTVLGLYYGIDLSEKEAVKELPVETILPAAVEVQMQDAVPEKEPEVAKAESSVADGSSNQQPLSQQPPPAEQLAAVETVTQSQQAPSEVEFRIQLAASRTLLTKEKASKLCSKPYPIDMAEENGWYKYYIAAGSSYENAKKTLSECGADKAFIVAYKDGRKITISEATQKTNP
jgi:hypothetical protein